MRESMHVLCAAALVTVGVQAVGEVRPTEHTLKVVSYNIRHGKGMDGRIDLKRIAEVIARTDPDLVALQEVDKNCRRSGNRDIAAELGSMLNMGHRFGKFMDFQGGEYGMAVLSRLPIAETTRHALPDGAEPRCALEVQVHVDGLPAPVSFIGIHSDWTNEEIRVQQIQALLNALSRHNHPTILAGDFNEERTGGSMKLLREDPWQILNKNGQKTCPSDNPTVEIDFVVIKHLHPTSVDHTVMEEKVASDHRPIFADLTFPGTP